MKNYLQSIAAYLTGWWIAHKTFNALTKKSTEERWDVEVERIVKRTAAEVERRIGLTQLARAAGLLERSGGGGVSLHYEPDLPFDLRWSSMGVFGREAPDSPMAGGAIHGVGSSPELALEQALKEAGA